MHRGEAAKISLIVFALIRSGLEPTIYLTRGEHANQYITAFLRECVSIENTWFIIFNPAPLFTIFLLKVMYIMNNSNPIKIWSLIAPDYDAYSREQLQIDFN